VDLVDTSYQSPTNFFPHEALKSSTFDVTFAVGLER
jgi:hypothetical protein